MRKLLNLHYDLNFNQSRKVAFQFLRDIKRRKEFMTIIDETKITKAVKNDDLKGLRFTEATHFLGFDMNLAYEVVDFKQGYTVVTACNDGPFYPRMGITLSDESEKTCSGKVDVTINTAVLKFIPSFILKPTIEAIIKPILKRMVNCINKS